MAIYRLSASVVKRSAGRSATAAAAYRSAASLIDVRTGLVFNYTRKRGVLHTEILAPANAPDWMRDRAQLWNAVELAEKRKDAQLAREILLSLPHELTDPQRLDLVRGFAEAKFIARGMIADICIHDADRRSDERNHHAHIMLTMRELTGQGFGKKARDWNEAEQLEHWREAWAAAVNRALEDNDHAARVDHRSLAARGIDREPEPKQGAVATAMEQEGRPSYAGADRRAAQERNQQRKSLGRELAAIIHDLETEQGREEQPAPARMIPKAGWTRYLGDLWRTVARGVTRPVAMFGVLSSRRRRRDLIP